MIEETNGLNAETIVWLPLNSILGCEKRVSAGTYNTVFVSEDLLTINGRTSLWIKKIPKIMRGEQANTIDAIDEAMNESLRAVRKWNDLNPGLTAYPIDGGWIAPYLGSTPASDEQIAEKLIEIYQRTRNILLDACGSMNFLVYEHETICVDVDQSMRRGSIASDNYLNQIGLYQHIKYWADYSVNHKKPHTVNVIQTLLYLEQNLDGTQIKDEYLTPSLIAKLHVFRRMGYILRPETMGILLTTTKLNLQHELNDGFITPHFINRLLALSEQQPLTEDIFFKERVLHQQLLPIKSLPSSFYTMFKLNGWAGITRLIDCAEKINPTFLDGKDDDGISLLHLLAAYGMGDLIERLIRLGVKLTETTSTFIYNTELFRMFPSNHSAMDLALIYGHDEVVKLLFNSRVMSSTIINGNRHIIHVMAKHNSLADVEWLVDREKQLINLEDKYGRTALTWAVASNNMTMVKFLLKQGANPNIPIRIPVGKDQSYHNYLALDWALHHDYPNIITLLLRYGARANRNQIPGLYLCYTTSINGEQTYKHRAFSIFNSDGSQRPARADTRQVMDQDLKALPSNTTTTHSSSSTKRGP